MRHPRSDRYQHRERQRQTTETTKLFLLSEIIIVIVFINENYASDQDVETLVFIIKTSFGIILKVRGPLILFTDDKYVSNQDNKTSECILKYSIAIFIKWVGEEDTWKITKYIGTSIESTAMVTVTKSHSYFQNKWVSVNKGVFFVERILNKNELH